MVMDISFIYFTSFLMNTLQFMKPSFGNPGLKYSTTLSFRWILSDPDDTFKAFFYLSIHYTLP